MNWNGMIRVFTRRMVNRGIRSGIQNYSRGGKDFSEMSTEEREQARSTQGQLNQGRRVFNLARRFMR